MTTVQLAQFSKRRSMPEKQHNCGAFRDQALFLRHGERLDHVNRMWRTTTTTNPIAPLLSLLPEADPPLSPAGRRQALETGFMFLQKQQHKKLGQRALGMLSLLLVSPFHRCIETALIVNIVGFDGKLAMFVDPLLSDWHSSKFFSHSPRLGGVYVFSSGTISFQPHWDVLYESLISFFRSIVTDTRYCVDHAMAKGWLTALKTKWCQRSSFLVWTSTSMQDTLWRSTYRGGNVAQRGLSRAHHESRNRGGVTGISYPESASELLRRVGEAIDTHFKAESDGAGSSVPRCVWEAVEKEARHLPRALVSRAEKMMMTTATATSEATPVAVTSMVPKARGGALLPSMRAMLVTHANIVSVALKHCCTSYHDVEKGFSVPYCSLTFISRSNDYYSDLRDESSVNGDGEHDKEKWSWCVERVGSTSHLQTAILLRYC